MLSDINEKFFRPFLDRDDRAYINHSEFGMYNACYTQFFNTEVERAYVIKTLETAIENYNWE